MSQSDGHTMTLHRIAFELEDGTWYRFFVNPQELILSNPQRSTVMKTKSDIIVEDFGKDIETIQFSGTTGHKKDHNGDTGYTRLVKLKDYIDKYANQAGNGNSSTNELTFHNFTDGYSYIVHLAKDGFKINRNAEKPILFDYSINLVVIRTADTPSDRDLVDATIGNEQTSIGGNTSSNTSPNTDGTGGSFSPGTSGGSGGGSGGGAFTGSGFSQGTSGGSGGGSGGGAFNDKGYRQGVINPNSTSKTYSPALNELKNQTGYNSNNTNTSGGGGAF